jgi:cell division protein FtsB
MSRLDDALARFSAALDRLDAQAGERIARDRDIQDSAAELNLMKAERERLYERIAGLEEESRTLAGLTEEVEDRLDGAISEIRDVLGRN